MNFHRAFIRRTRELREGTVSAAVRWLAKGADDSISQSADAVNIIEAGEDCRNRALHP
jgi:hypothetical protein